jgi:hypothetical protein
MAIWRSCQSQCNDSFGSNVIEVVPYHCRRWDTARHWEEYKENVHLRYAMILHLPGR